MVITTVSLHTSGYKKGRRWHYHNVRELIIKNNYNYSKAGKEAGLKRSHIAFLANKFGLLEEAREQRAVLKKLKLKEDIKKAKELFKKGLNITDIAREIHKSNVFTSKAVNYKRRNKNKRAIGKLR